jgi:hypothetical protein
MNVYDEIQAERTHQDQKYGGPSHDDKHTPQDWETHLHRHTDRLLAARRGPDFNKTQQGHYVVGPTEDYRKRLIKIAALAVAAIESWDRRGKK